RGLERPFQRRDEILHARIEMVGFRLDLGGIGEFGGDGPKTLFDRASVHAPLPIALSEQKENSGLCRIYQDRRGDGGPPPCRMDQRSLGRATPVAGWFFWGS